MDLDSDEELETSDGVKNKGPGIIAMDVAAQMVICYLVIMIFSLSAVFLYTFSLGIS